MFFARLSALALAATVVASVLVATPAAAEPRTYYVATNGSDRNPGTRTAPFRTIEKAFLTLRPGDTLYVRGGTFNEHVGGPREGFVFVTPGRADARIRVAAYQNERPVVAGLVWLDNMDHWTIDGLNVTWNSTLNSGGDHMVRLRNGVGWTWEDSEIWGARSFANVNILSSVAGEPANWSLERNCIHDNYGDPNHSGEADHLIYANTGLTAGSGLIAENLLFDAPRGKAIKLAGPDPGTGSANVTIRYNTIDNTYKPGIVVGYRTHHTTITRNLLVDTDDMAFIRGYELVGTSNVASHNAGHGAPDMFYNDAGYVRITDGGGNRLPLDPRFDATGTCSGYHPANADARAYGRWAGG